MSKKSPLQATKEQFGDKKKLVEAVKGFVTDELWLGRTNADRGGDKGLERVSNAKLLKLHATFSAVKETFGTRAKLIDAILDAEKRNKDEGFKKRLETQPVPRLYDHYKSTQKRAKSDGAPAGDSAKASAKPAAAKKASAKPAAQATKPKAEKKS